MMQTFVRRLLPPPRCSRQISEKYSDVGFSMQPYGALCKMDMVCPGGEYRIYTCGGALRNVQIEER